MEVRLNIDDAFLNELQQKIGMMAKPADLTREALAIFNWAIEEAAAGRFVISTNSKGEDVRRLALPTLILAENKAKQRSSAPAEEQTALTPSFL